MKKEDSNAIKWMNELLEKSPSILFRGQNQVYENIFPSVYRQSEIKRKAVLHLCREVHRYASGITGFAINSRFDEVGLVQHYMEVSPIIDLTGTPEIALFFAIMNSENKDTEQVIYAFLEEDLEKHSLEVSDHNFMLLPLDQDGHKCRWIRQDGFGVCKRNFSKFDLLEVPHKQLTFTPNQIDIDTIASYANVLSTWDDPIANQVYSFLHLLSEKLGYSNILCAELHRHGYVHPSLKIRNEIDELMYIAMKHNLRDEIQEIKKFHKANNKRLWDMAWEAALVDLKRRLSRD